MKKMILTATFAAMALMTSPAFAGESSSTVDVSSSTNASVVGGETRHYSTGGVGAAYCTGGFSTPFFGVSMTNEKCRKMNGLFGLFDRGALSVTELRVQGLALLGYGTKKTETVVATRSVATSVTPASGQTKTVRVAGKAWVLRGDQVARWENCGKIRFGGTGTNGVLGKKSGCN